MGMVPYGMASYVGGGTLAWGMAPAPLIVCFILPQAVNTALTALRTALKTAQHPHTPPL